MHLPKEIRRAKLETLMRAEGSESFEALCQDVIGDSVSPAICVEAGCDYITEMEPDQEHGYCEGCARNSVVSALVLAGLI